MPSIAWFFPLEDPIVGPGALKNFGIVWPPLSGHTCGQLAIQLRRRSLLRSGTPFRNDCLTANGWQRMLRIRGK